MFPFPVVPKAVFLAANGGRGSFAFGDTSVYGERGVRATDPHSVFRSYDPPRQVVPGSGGGAKANHQMPFGSHAVGFSPNGVVLIRLTRIE